MRSGLLLCRCGCLVLSCLEEGDPACVFKVSRCSFSRCRLRYVVPACACSLMLCMCTLCLLICSGATSCEYASDCRAAAPKHPAMVPSGTDNEAELSASLDGMTASCAWCVPCSTRCTCALPYLGLFACSVICAKLRVPAS